MLEACKWLEIDSSSNCLICTDYLVETLENNTRKDPNEKLKEIKSTSSRITETVVTILWIPFHVKIHGNSLADELANCGTRMSQESVPVLYHSVRALILRRSWRPKHLCALQLYIERHKHNLKVEKTWPQRV